MILGRSLNLIRSVFGIVLLQSYITFHPVYNLHRLNGWGVALRSMKVNWPHYIKTSDSKSVIRAREFYSERRSPHKYERYDLCLSLILALLFSLAIFATLQLASGPPGKPLTSPPWQKRRKKTTQSLTRSGNEREPRELGTT